MIQEFINQYGSGMINYKKYDNGIVRIKFDNNNGISTMELKRIFCEKYGYEIKTSSVLKNSSTYWFNPVN